MGNDVLIGFGFLNNVDILRKSRVKMQMIKMFTT